MKNEAMSNAEVISNARRTIKDLELKFYIKDGKNFCASYRNLTAKDVKKAILNNEVILTF